MAGDDFVDGDDNHDPHHPEDAAAAVAQLKERQHHANEQFLARVRHVQEAYLRLFAGKPMDSDAQTVLDDLAAFCRAKQTTFHESERIHVLLTGRQEVYLRVMDHLRLNFDTLVEQRYTLPRTKDKD